MNQTADLLEALRETRLRLPVLIAVMCGLRRGEIVALRWKDIDLAAGKMAVVESAETDDRRSSIQAAEIGQGALGRTVGNGSR